MHRHCWAGGRSLQHDKHQWRQCVPRSWRRSYKRIAKWAKKWRLFNKKMMRLGHLVLFEKSVYLFQDLKILVKYLLLVELWANLLGISSQEMFSDWFCVLPSPVLTSLGPALLPGASLSWFFCDLQGQSIYHFPFAPEQFQYLMPSAAY